MGKFDGEFRLLYKVTSCRPGRSRCQLLPEWERSRPFRGLPHRPWQPSRARAERDAELTAARRQRRLRARATTHAIYLSQAHDDGMRTMCRWWWTKAEVTGRPEPHPEWQRMGALACV